MIHFTLYTGGSLYDGDAEYTFQKDEKIESSKANHMGDEYKL